jgi:hypothetical protein
MSCENWKIFSNLLEQYKDTLVLDLFNVVQLVGLEDGEDDYYWVYSDGFRETRSSCVGMFIPLNECDFYEDLVYVWNLNYINKAK